MTNVLTHLLQYKVLENKNILSRRGLFRGFVIPIANIRVVINYRTLTAWSPIKSINI